MKLQKYINAAWEDSEEIERKTTMELIWNEENENAVVYEVRSDSPEIILPETIEGRDLVAARAYCFSNRKRKETMENRKIAVFGEPSEHKAQGEFVEKIVLPDTLERIENAAFFNCKKLAILEVGKNTKEIGSDVFNNCGALQVIRIRGKAGEETGAKSLLARVSWDIEVRFDDASFFYPEYYEGYDTIAPAHIFSLNIEGEGFRARQSFRDGKVDCEAYDAIFEKACAEESARVLVHMAMDRLITPVGLTEKNRLRYEKYLQSVQKDIFEICLKNRNIEWLSFAINSLLSGDKIEKETREEALEGYVQQGWTEGTAVLLAAGKKKSGKGRSRYEFD
ncbi:MAG: leucine-rich repeat protein [Eubacterium sp.]